MRTSPPVRSEEHTSELQSLRHLVCRPPRATLFPYTTRFRSISVKQTQETGSAFRPAREADMMRRLVERHKGILPLDTAESIWRVIISTFTFVQAPFSVHADLSAGDASMRDSARFHF